MLVKVHTIVSVILVMAVSGMAQEPAIYNYSIEQGLPSVEVYDILQDSKGLLWFSTDNGVVRFDGNKMEVFRKSNNLVDPVVFKSIEDRRGRIWFRSFSGQLSYYDKGRIHPYEYNDIVTNLCRESIMTSLSVDSLGKITFGSNGIFFSISEDGETIESDTLGRSSLEFKWGKDLMVVEGRFFGNGGINRIVINKDEFQIDIENMDNAFSSTMDFVEWKGDLYLSIYNYLLRYDGESLTQIPVKNAGIIGLNVDRSGSLWVCYFNNGVQRFSDTTFSNPTSIPSLEDYSVTAVQEDQHGGLWFSTLEKGVFNIPNLRVKQFGYFDGEKIKSFISTDREILCGTYDGKIFGIDVNSGTVSLKKDLKSPILKLLKDNSRNIWVSIGSGVYLFDESFTKELAVYPQQSVIFELAQDESGVVWGISSRRMIRLGPDNKDGVFYRTLPYRARKLFFHHDRLFAIGRLGVQIYDEDGAFLASALDGEKISKLLPLSDSTIIAATVGVGYKILTSAGKVVHSSTPPFGHDIYDIAFIDSLVIMGTENGIAIIRSNELSGELTRYQVINKRSGIAGNKVNALVRANNMLWVFTDNGLSLIGVRDLSTHDTTPRFYLEEIAVNDEVRDFVLDTHLPHDETNINVDFGFISFKNQNISVRYRTNQTAEWIYTRERSIKFSSLAAGDYDLQIEYSVDNINWIPAEFEATFTVLPVFWKRWYFQLWLAGILVLGFYFYFRYQLGLYRQRQQYLEIINNHQAKLIQLEIAAIERERSRIAKELHDGVGTHLTGIKLVATQILKSFDSIESDKLEANFQQVIKEIKEIIHGLTPPGLERYGLYGALKNHVEKLRQLDVDIQLEMFGENIKDPVIGIVVFRILQELMSNSLKHSSAKNITIQIESFDEFISVLYTDNGVGFSENSNGKGYGLQNIESRIKSVDGKINFETGKFGVSYAIDIPRNQTSDIQQER